VLGEVFATHLKELHVRAGKPTMRALAARTRSMVM
jgi:hypothetical protein